MLGQVVRPRLSGRRVQSSAQGNPSCDPRLPPSGPRVGGFGDIATNHLDIGRPVVLIGSSDECSCALGVGSEGREVGSDTAGQVPPLTIFSARKRAPSHPGHPCY